MQKSMAAALIAGALSTACSIDVNGAGSVVTEEKIFQLTGQPDLKLHTFDGSIEVRSWDRNEVSVEIRRRAASDEEARALEVTTTQDGNRIVIDAPGRERRRVIRIGSWAGEDVSFVHGHFASFGMHEVIRQPERRCRVHPVELARHPCSGLVEVHDFLVDQRFAQDIEELVEISCSVLH